MLFVLYCASANKIRERDLKETRFLAKGVGWS